MAIKMIWIIVFTILVNTYGSSVENYTKIWEDGMNLAQNWSRPTHNEDFLGYEQQNCTIYGTYDFIIVGAGSTGSVIANRLSEISSWKILLLEAGEDENEFTMMPGPFPAMLLSPVNWGYLTVPQKYFCQGSINKQCDHSRGKVLGGSSSVNAMLYVRGHPNDFDDWLDGWSYEHVLPYFKKSENATGVSKNKCFRGFKGPMKISYPNPSPPLLKQIINAHEEAGIPFVSDFNSGKKIGISKLQLTTKEGRRWSTNQAYLKPIIGKRNNLQILTKAFVTKINVIKKKAKSLNFLHNKKCFEVHAEKEIILSAGAINTPQLLLLSGIGPKEDLNKLGIDVIANLPVGLYLDDHPTIFNLNFNTNYTPDFNFKDSVMEYPKGEGWMTYPKAFEVNFLNISNSKVPDVEVIFNLIKSFIPPDLLKRHCNYDTIMDPYLASIKPTYIATHHILLHAKSRGTLKLKSANPLEYPIIDPNYLDHPDDWEYLYLGVQETLKLLETDSFKKLNVSLAEIPLAPCEKIMNDKDKWFCVFKYLGQGIFHPASTCRMGNNKTKSVVDKNLKVHGIDGLRIADVSVLPTQTSGHLNAVAIMIGEKISDEIKKYWLNK